MSEWQPIETAPKDGTPILVWARDWDRHAIVAWTRIEAGGWKNEEWGISLSSQNTHDPSHWMPLPEPPQR